MESCAAAVAPWRPSPEGRRVAATLKRSDGGSGVEDVALESFMKQSICPGIPDGAAKPNLFRGRSLSEADPPRVELDAYVRFMLMATTSFAFTLNWGGSVSELLLESGFVFEGYHKRDSITLSAISTIRLPLATLSSSL